MVMSILISLLSSLLGTFLSWLFKRWLDQNHPPVSLEQAKPFFMDRVKSRIWYGPTRMDVASRLYDKVVERYHSPYYAVQVSGDREAAYDDLAKRLVKDISLE